MLTTNSFVRRILASVSLVRPSGRLLAANMQSAAFDPLFLAVNLHPTPRTWDFAMVGAFMGLDFMWRAYAEAIREGYRFYSFGDAMLIL